MQTLIRDMRREKGVLVKAHAFSSQAGNVPSGLEPATKFSQVLRNHLQSAGAISSKVCMGK